MKYNQPHGISDPNAPYINGNPSTGTMGSIPPAASIEYPQREIANLINSATKADLSGPLNTPANTDLYQLAKGVQSNLMNSARDTGIANFYACNLTPPIIAYFEGLEVILKIKNENTGPSVLNINALGNRPIVNASDQMPISAGLLHVNAWVMLKYDGTNFQVCWSQGGGGSTGEPIYLLTPKTFYVNASAGNDSWDGTVAAFSTGIHGPFQTLQRAADETQKYNLNNYSIQIMVANGTYADVYLRKYSGSGLVYWRGNKTTPGSCVISAAASRNSIDAFDCGAHWFEGFRLINNGPSSGGVPCFGVWAHGNTYLQIGWMEFGYCHGAQVAASSYAIINFINASPNKIVGAPGGVSWLGSHCTAYFGGQVGSPVSDPATMTITTPITVPYAFVQVATLGICNYTFGGGFTGSAVTGKKFDITSNAILNLQAGGVNYLPGSVPGTLGTGGQII